MPSRFLQKSNIKDHPSKIQCKDPDLERIFEDDWVPPPKPEEEKNPLMLLLMKIPKSPKKRIQFASDIAADRMDKKMNALH
jgi:hypothetical protein